MIDLDKILTDQEAEEALKWIEKKKVRAKYWYLGKHVTLAVLWFQISINIHYSFDRDDEYPNIFELTILIFHINISW